MDLDIIEYLERTLEEELPGKTAHLKLSPVKDYYPEAPLDHKVACVLILLFPKYKKWHIIFVKRAANEGDNHSSQIGFPGGKLEESDYSHSDCALRETHEELGLDPSSVGIVGELSSIYVQASNFVVYPFVGFTSNEPEFILEPSEVEYIIECPLTDILDNRLIKNKSITLSNGTNIQDAPYFNIKNETVWGATAMMLSEFKEVLAKTLENLNSP
jgi:8-oxo-dGTP pyrophosphatase MutT (NUDIX family)